MECTPMSTTSQKLRPEDIPVIETRPSLRPVWFYLICFLALLAAAVVFAGEPVMAPPFTIHPWVDRILAGGIVPQLLFTFAFMLLGLAPRHVFNRLFVKMRIDSVGITLFSGIIARSRDFLPYQTVESIELYRGPLGRLMGFGRLSVLGRGGQVITTPSVSRPTDVMDAVEYIRINLGS